MLTPPAVEAATGVETTLRGVAAGEAATGAVAAGAAAAALLTASSAALTPRSERKVPPQSCSADYQEWKPPCPSFPSWFVLGFLFFGCVFFTYHCGQERYIINSENVPTCKIYIY